MPRIASRREPVKGLSFCDVGDAGRIVIQSQPSGTGRLDALGRVLHPTFVFPVRTEERWVRRVLQWTLSGAVNAVNEPVSIEADAGSYYVPRKCSVQFAGGALDETWDIDVIEVPNCEPGPFEFWLTTTSPALGNIIRPAFHSVVRLVSGTLNVNGVAITDPASPPIPLDQSTITAALNTVYQTGGKV